MSRKRVLLTIPNFETAGSQLVVLDILRGLDRQAFEPLVCVFHRGGLDEQVQALDAPLFVAPFAIDPNPRTTLLPRAKRAASAFRDLEVDIWHSWHYLDDYTEPLIARYAGAKKWIYTKKNMSWGSNAWRLRSLLADSIVAINPIMISRFFSSYWYRRKARFIPVGVDTGLFRSSHQEESALWRELHPYGDEPLVGCVANLLPVKDHPTLIRAIAVAESKPRLVLIGRGEEAYRASLQALTAQLGVQERVHFWGQVPNRHLPPILSGLDVFALTSSNEGLGAALVEAMACECACVATRSGGPDAIIENGVDGFLVEVGDHITLAERMDLLARNPVLRREMGHQARHKVTAQFSLAAQNAGYDRLYKELSGLA